MDESDPVVLVNSKVPQIVLFSDSTPCTEVHKSQITYDYTTSFTLDDSSQQGYSTPSTEVQKSQITYDYTTNLTLEDSSHKGLGFHEEATPTGIGSSLQFEEQEDPFSDTEEMDVDNNYTHEMSTEVVNDLEARTPSRKKNSWFLAIGGMKFYTEDISDEEDDDDNDNDGEESLDGESSESSGSENSSGSSDEDSSSSDSDIDEDIANDYIEGIGGIDLQDGSREYGMKKPRSKKKFSVGNTMTTSYGWSSILDDYMLVKDPRSLSGRKKQVARFPQSWPGEGRGSKNFRNPGEKKKHRKELIAVKR